jgi:hypothetical protein
VKEGVFLQRSLEQELIIQLIQFRKPDKNKIIELTRKKLDWAQVLGHLVYNRVAGVAHHVIRECRLEPFNREFELALYMNFEIQSLRTAAYIQCVERISQLFQEGGLPHAFLKGSFLAQSIFPLGCRISNDIDVLVEGVNLTRCSNILKDASFIQGSYDRYTKKVTPASREMVLNNRMNYGEVVPYILKSEYPGIEFIQVDINFSLDWKAKGTTEQVAKFVGTAIEYQMGKGYIYSLQSEFFLIHLCVHLYKEAVGLRWIRNQRDLSLYKFLDIYAFITDSKILVNPDKLISIIKENILEKACYFALESTRRFFPILEEHQELSFVLDAIRPDQLHYMEEVIDPQYPDQQYYWTKDMLTRFFDLHRQDKYLVKIE